MREAREGRRAARAEGNCFSGPAEPGNRHMGPGSRAPRRKASDGSEAGACSKLCGLMDQQVLLTSVPRPYHECLPLRWSPNICLTPPTIPLSFKGAEQVCGALMQIPPRKDPGLALLRAENAHCTSQGICLRQPLGAWAGSAETRVLRQSPTWPLHFRNRVRHPHSEMALEHWQERRHVQISFKLNMWRAVERKVF